jgi:LytR cell envelope-related transcriptional attenuator
VNTGTARIVIIVALLVTGGLVLANAFGDAGVAATGGPSGGGTSPTPSSLASVSGTQSPTPPPTPDPQPPKDIAVAVFNGTNIPGLAGIVLDQLTGAGYKAGQVPTDAPQKPVDKTAVYFLGGPDAAQNESNATALADKYFKDAKIRELSADLCDLVDKGVQVVVVVGVNDQPA